MPGRGEDDLGVRVLVNTFDPRLPRYVDLGRQTLDQAKRRTNHVPVGRVARVMRRTRTCIIRQLC